MHEHQVRFAPDPVLRAPCQQAGTHTWPLSQLKVLTMSQKEYRLSMGSGERREEMDSDVTTEKEKKLLFSHFLFLNLFPLMTEKKTKGGRRCLK